MRADNINGTKTEANLISAFNTASRAGMKYSYGARAAKLEGSQQLSGLLTDVSLESYAHSGVIYEMFNKDSMKVWDAFKRDVLNDYAEIQKQYEAFAETARNENLDEIAGFFIEMARIEKRKGEELIEKLTDLEKNNAHIRTEKKRQNWVCVACGHEHPGVAAPDECPLCHLDKRFILMKMDPPVTTFPHHPIH